ncbi:MAG: uracil-DNA glycosylase [Paenibacillaceae bacterium]|nr:uracil-DNA glycosylase [Paenibacillaceae bacterium]
MKLKEPLSAFVQGYDAAESFQFSDIDIDTSLIQAIMINEVVPGNPADDFYGRNSPPAYLTTTLPLFHKAGFQASSVDDLIAAGIYMTNAVKIPKTESAIPRDILEKHVPVLEYEIGLFPNLKVIMLMGDVAKKAFNMIAKARTGKTAVPSISTYKLRNSELYYENIRIFPSYIMTGGNILIEKSKVEMAAGDIQKMLEIIRQS